MNAHICTKRKSDRESANKRITEVYVGSMILAAAETKGIGSVRMAELLTNFGEWLDYFSENNTDGIGMVVMRKRLEERGLLEVFESLVPSEKE